MALSDEQPRYCREDHSQGTMQSARLHVHPPVRHAAPRQGAQDGDAESQLRQTEYGDHATLHALGIAVRIGTKVPTGAAVRLDVHDTAIWLEPEEAKRLSIALDIAAVDAVHEDRAARRG